MHARKLLLAFDDDLDDEVLLELEAEENDDGGEEEAFDFEDDVEVFYDDEQAYEEMDEGFFNL